MSAPTGPDVTAEIAAAVTGIIAGSADAGAPWDAALRDALAEAGFHRIGVPEPVGGSGGTLRELAVVVDLLAYHAARLPVADEAFVAGWLIAGAGLTVPDGIALAALEPVDAEHDGGALRVSGSVTVPWGRYASAVALLARADGSPDRLVVLPGHEAWTEGANLAGEPRDRWVLDGVEVPAGRHALAAEGTATALLRRAALLRSIQLAGAARAVLDLTVRYVQEREQFGRPLAAFQAVQQQVAVLAGEVNMMQMAAAAAVITVESAEEDPALQAESEVAVAAAKATTSSSARSVAAIGHQLHGALGYSAEHPLGAVTSRLWAWRDECGNEARWHDELGEIVVRRGAWWSSIAGSVTETGGRS